MKVFKRNAVIITVLLFVCVAVYLNWSYSNDSTDADTIAETSDDGSLDAANVTDEGDSEDSGLYYENDAISNYFATARLNREQARDEATTTLSAISDSEGASQETIDEALAEIADMASYSVTEAQLESLIISKGFNDCVVFISEGSINVTVPSPTEGLSSAAVARIKDLVTSETDFTVEDIKIIEVK